jgi:Tol biopolymer transport system component
MSETRLEDKVREVLRTQAATQPFSVSSVFPAVRGARLRLLRNGIVVGVLGLIAAVVAIENLPPSLTETSLPAATQAPPLPHGDGTIAFVGAGDHDIFTVEPDGSGLVRLTDCGAPCGSVGGLAWSPDGSTLLFSRFADKFDPVADVQGPLYAMDADGSNLRPLTDCHAPSCWDGRPVWSPDGTHVAFVRDHAAESGVYVIEADGSNLTLVSTGETGTGALSWSPDGTRIAFDHYTDPNGTATIFIAEADGAGTTTLVSGEGLPSRPAWSPDGTLIAYTSDDAYISKEGVDPPPRARIWVIGVDGTDRRLLYTGARGSADPGNLGWSPSGSKLAFSVAPTSQTVAAFVVDADGSNLRPLSGDGFRMVWSPSGRSIAEVVGGDLVVVSSDGTGARVVTGRLGLFGVAWQPVDRKSTTAG